MDVSSRCHEYEHLTKPVFRRLKQKEKGRRPIAAFTADAFFLRRPITVFLFPQNDPSPPSPAVVLSRSVAE